MTVDPDGPTISCKLEPAELPGRRAAWERLLERALRERRPTPDGFQLVFAPLEGVEQDLRALARLEAECCSFADWKVARNGDEVRLDVTAEGDGVAAARALFEAIGA